MASDLLMKMHGECSPKEHVRFADQLKKPGRRVQTAHRLFVEEAEAREGRQEEAFVCKRYSCTMKEKEARTLRPLEETAQSCKRALARWLLLWPVILLGAVSCKSTHR